jgi:hypothetical protein
MSRLLLVLLLSSLWALHSPRAALAEPPTTAPARPSNSPAPPSDLTEIKIQMAEARLNLVQSDRNLNALVSALEEFINRSCFSELTKTLKYDGPPTDLICISRMEQLLKVNPDNPVGLCLRDGIDAKSCADAYKTQKVVEYYASESLLADLPDPSLKVGLSAAETERIRVHREMLSNINKQYSEADTDEQKGKCLNDAVGIYDQLLATACRVSALRLRRSEERQESPSEPSRVAEARKKLLQIPPTMRADYQRQMREQVEDELARYRGDDRGKQELVQLIAAIDQPDITSEHPRYTDLRRTRILLPTCFNTLEQAKAFLPDYPGGECYSHGFQTPTCIRALREWRAKKELARKAEKARLSRTPAAKKPAEESMIATF